MNGENAHRIHENHDLEIEIGDYPVLNATI
jgi:hypothetical protein